MTRKKAEKKARKKAEKKAKKRPAVGATSANFHEARRSEYLAHYVFASFGTCIAVPTQEDTGLDLYCTIAERIGQRIWPRAYYGVQVKSEVDSWIFPIPESVEWLVRFPLPIFLCLVLKREARLKVYRTQPRFVIWAQDPLPEQLEIRPGTGGDEYGRADDRTFYVGEPFLDFTIADTLEDTFLASKVSTPEHRDHGGCCTPGTNPDGSACL
jgi:hypothetical protein